MALKGKLRLIARRISEAARRSSSLQGLLPGDYALAGTIDEATDQISLTLGTDRTIDGHRWYADTLQEIRRVFPEAPQITMQIGLVIRHVENLEEVYWEAAGSESERDFTEMLEIPADRTA